jgi:hypothetical protein
MPVIPHTQEVRINTIMVGGQPAEKFSETPISPSKLGMVTCVSNSSYAGGIGRRIRDFGWFQIKNSRPYPKDKQNKEDQLCGLCNRMPV